MKWQQNNVMTEQIPRRNEGLTRKDFLKLLAAGSCWNIILK
ncbi:MAG: hypothetical protein ACREA3_06505 [Nitrosotalea sp.]